MAGSSCTKRQVTLTARPIIRCGSAETAAIICGIGVICGFKFGIWIKIKPSGALRRVLERKPRSISGAYCWTHGQSCSFFLEVYEHDARNSITTYELSQCCTRRVQGHGRPGVLLKGVRHRTNLDRAGQAPGVANEW